MMPSWCRQVNWGNCGILWVNCAVLFVKDDWKGQFWDLSYFLSKLRSLLSFSVRCDIVQFNWEYLVPLLGDSIMLVAADTVRSILNRRMTCVKIVRSVTHSKMRGFMPPLPYTPRIGDQFFKAQWLLYTPSVYYPKTSHILLHSVRMSSVRFIPQAKTSTELHEGSVCFLWRRN